MITYHPYDQTTVDALRAGEPDANGQPAERAISDGQGTPCRSCLRNVPAGAEMLICAIRPFPTLQPYAETGPAFFCAQSCAPYRCPAMPSILQTSPDYLMKGYSADHRIVYGTGQITGVSEIVPYAQSLLDMGDVAFVDVRSARNNCFLTRITATHD